MESALWVPPLQHVDDYRGGVLHFPIKVLQHLNNFCLKWMEIAAKLSRVKVVEVVMQLPA